MKKNIAVFIPGGIDKKNNAYIPVLMQLLAGLADDSYLTVFTFSTFIGIDFSTETPYKVIALNRKKHQLKMMLFTHLYYEFKKANKATKFDLIHVFWALPCGLSGIILGRLFSIPVLLNLMGGEFAEVKSANYGNLLKPFRRFLTLWTCRQADYISSLTNYIREKVELVLDRHDIIVIPHGCDRSTFPFKERVIPSKQLNCIHIANLNPVKQTEFLLHCFAKLSVQIESKLKIVGTDFRNGYLQKLCTALKINEAVEFVGYVQYDQLPPFYQWADILLHTSHYEAQGIVINEAASSGLLIAGTDVGLIHDLPDSAKLTATNPDDLAGKILETINEPLTYREKVNSAHEWVLQRDLNWSVDQYRKLYSELIN